MELSIREVQEQYWEDVKSCLIEFHHLPERQASSLTNEFKRKYYKSMIYHDEAFDTANWIASNDLCYSDYKEKYKQLLKKSYLAAINKDTEKRKTKSLTTVQETSKKYKVKQARTYPKVAAASNKQTKSKPRKKSSN